MPVTGTKPKPEGQAVHRNKPAFEWTEVPDVPFTDGPRLPFRTPNGDRWPDWTRKWWTAISRLPQCALWNEGDWQYAMDTAVVAATFHSTTSMAAAAELRNREKILGTTMDARRDLRIRYVPAVAPPTTEGVTLLDNYRDL